MLKELLGRRPFLRLLAQAFIDEILCMPTNTGPFDSLKIWLILIDRSENLIWCLLVEWRITREQEVYQNTGAPDVDFLIIFLFPCDFGRHIEERSHACIKLLVLVKEGCKAEINELDLDFVFQAALIYEDIL